MADAPSLRPSARANANVKKAQRKKVIAALNVNACGWVRSSDARCSGSYTVDCMFAARMLPHSMYGFQSGHSPCSNDCRTALCQGIICM
jgi:hypothetical protein